MNGVTRELFANGWVDEGWVAAHTMGVDDLRSTVAPYTPEHVTGICGVDADDVRRAARIFGECTLVQTTWTVIAQGAQGLRDQELLEVATSANAETSRQLSW